MDCRKSSDIARNISVHGQHLMAVHGDDQDPLDFIYTIGNDERGLPELLLLGGCDPVDGHILNILGEMLRERARAFEHGALLDFGAKYPAKVINANARAKDEYTVQAGQYHGTERYRVQQVLLFDPAGRYPDDPTCEQPYRVPVLALE